MAPDSGDQCTPGDEAPNRGLRAHEARELEIEPAFEEDHRDREFDDVEQTFAETSGFHPAEPFGPQPHANDQQDHYTGDAEMLRNRLRDDPGGESDDEGDDGGVHVALVRPDRRIIRP